ncbi:MAG: HAMP domain-containing protein [Acidobacteria bacterium]|nr:HAMP domain-containing protein [Acidobacteriota bacterium]
MRRRVIRTRVGRRLLLAFVAFALAPIALLVALSLHQVTSNLLQQSRSRLHQQCKAAAMGVIERLLLLRGEVEVISTALEPSGAAPAGALPPELSSRLHGHFVALALRLPDGGTEQLLGSRAALPSLDRVDRQHLAAGETAIVTAAGTRTMARVFLVHQLGRGSGPATLVVAELDGEYLWGVGSMNVQPPFTDLCVVDRTGTMLVRSTGIPDGFPRVLAQAASRSEDRRFEWQSQGKVNLAALWPIPMEVNYRAGVWTVVLSEAKSHVLAPVNRFTYNFVLVALLAVVSAVLLGLSQIRKTLVPLQKLREGARRVTGGDFAVRVEAGGRDEFDELAETFNVMAGHLGRQIAALSSMTEVARGALTGAGTRDIASALLYRLPQLVPLQWAELLLVDPLQPEFVHRLRLSPGAASGQEQGGADLGRVESDDNGRIGVVFSANAVKVKDTQRGALAVAAERSDAEQQADVTVSLAAGGERLGRLALRVDGSSELTDEESSHVSDVAEQLALALHEAALRQRLEEERMRLAELVEYLPYGVLVLDRSERILMGNLLARQDLPLLAEARIGDVLTGLGERSISEIREATAEEGGCEVTPEDLPQRVFEVMAGTLGGGQAGTVLLVRDVTELRENQRRAEQQERLAAVGQLAAGIAHDFNNILQGMMMAAELLYLDEGIGREERRTAGEIFQQGERAARLIRQILDFSRQSVAAPRPLDLAVVAREQAKLLDRTLPESIRLELDIAEGEMTVKADPVQVQQVLTNLAINARDAMPRGGQLRIVIDTVEQGGGKPSLGAGPPAGSWVRIRVSDTGAGIPGTVLPRIWEPFFTTKERGRGTGLGLSQVYGIVVQNGGSVECSSAEGVGTSFTVLWPRLVRRPDQAGTTSESDLPRSHGEETILVLEDEAQLRDVTASGLRQLGYRVLTAGTGVEAGELLADEAVDLLLADVVLPSSGEAELVDLILGMEGRLSILLFSGYPRPPVGGQRELPGVADWLQKPVSLEELARAVRRALDSAQ